MKITDATVRLAGREEANTRIMAYVTVVFDHCFVVQDIKVIRGDHGPFVAMPSRKVSRPCPRCYVKNVMAHNYCGNCGRELPKVSAGDREGESNFRDIAHPISKNYREYFQDRVLAYYEKAVSDQRTSEVPA